MSWYVAGLLLVDTSRRCIRLTDDTSSALGVSFAVMTVSQSLSLFSQVPVCFLLPETVQYPAFHVYARVLRETCEVWFVVASGGALGLSWDSDYYVLHGNFSVNLLTLTAPY